MKKYIIEVDIPDENETHVFELNLGKLLLAVEESGAIAISEALKNGHEIRLSKTNSKKLKQMEKLGEKLGLNR